MAFTSTLNGWDNSSKTATVSDHRLVYTFSDLGTLSALGSDWSDIPAGANAAFQFVAPGSWDRAVKADFNLNDGNFRVRLTEGAVNTVEIDAGSVPTLVDQASAVRVNGVVENPINSIDRSVFMFPGGRWKALVMSYDDGHDQDRGLVPILNANGIKGTFHLNSNSLGYDTFVTRDEVSSLYTGHEVSSHTVDHPYLDQLSDDSIHWEIGTDCSTLGSLAGYSIRSMSYPFGAFNNNIMSIAYELGVRSSRTTLDTYNTAYLPPNPLKWHPTCHHCNAQYFAEQFVARTAEEMHLLFIWGHSYELDYGASNNSWDYISSLCSLLGNCGDVWYVGMAELTDYLTALRNLSHPSTNCIYNPSDNIIVWAKLNGTICRIQPGKRMTYPAGQVHTLPETPVQDNAFSIRYTPDSANTLASASNITAHIGHDGWQDVQDVLMTRESTATWTCPCPSFSGAQKINVAFTDGLGVWDDNGGSDWAVSLRSASTATPAAIQLNEKSPVISSGTSGQNNIGDNLEIPAYAAMLTTTNQGGFGSFGSIWISGDNDNLYLCADACRPDGSNNAQVIFLSVDTLSDGLENLWNIHGTPYGLDFLHNLALSPAAHIAILVGDEYGDGTFTHFELGSGSDFGQGIFYLSSAQNLFIPVPGARLSQFDGSGTNQTLSTDDDGNRQTDRWEAAIPWRALNAACGYHSVKSLYISGVIASASVSENNRYLSSNILGASASGDFDGYGNYGFNFVTLSGIRIGMPFEDSDVDGMTDLQEALAGTDAEDAGSLLQLDPPIPQDGSALLQFASVPGRRYQLQYKTDLNGPTPWTNLGSPITAAESLITTVGLSNPPGTVFYRVRLVTP